ncbi:MAG: hypothetical protein EOP86_19225 [Verrucomicrobiaceae bacterium]|nr:MAG: hypothetical protein EOP86_19225 [Verrucomicrobiaceae bacterium]
MDLTKGISNGTALNLTLIPRTGIVRKTPPERLWLTTLAPSAESLITATILHEDVRSRIRRVIAQENGIQPDLTAIKTAVERDILKLE